MLVVMLPCIWCDDGLLSAASHRKLVSKAGECWYISKVCESMCISCVA